MAGDNNSTHSKSDHARLPSFGVLQRAYLNGRPQDVKMRIGGDLNTPNFVDTCAMRMSWTLNHVNITIPGPHYSNMYVLHGDPIGGHNQWYAIRHAEIREWLRHNLGAPQISERGTSININHFAEFHGRPAKGIIVLDVAYIQNPGQPNATGHIDLWDGRNFTEDSEYGKEADTFRAASRADLWIAPD